MKYVVIGPITKAIWRPWIVGRRNVPAEGAATVMWDDFGRKPAYFTLRETLAAAR